MPGLGVSPAVLVGRAACLVLKTPTRPATYPAAQALPEAYFLMGGAGFVLPTPLAVSDFKNDVYSVGEDSKTFGVWMQGADYPGYEETYAVLTPTAGVGIKIEADALLLGVIASGYLNPDQSLFDALDVTEGFTFVIDYSLASAGSRIASVGVYYDDDPNYAEGWGFGSNFAGGNPAISQNTLSDNAFVEGPLATDPELVASGSHRAAASFSQTELAMSVDGNAAVSVAPTSANLSVNQFYVLPKISSQGAGLATVIVEKIIIYALQDAADLPALSA